MAYLWTQQNQRLYVMRPGARVAVLSPGMASPLLPASAGRAMRDRPGLLETSRAAHSVAAALGLLLLWSVSYLVRQPDWDMASPLFGDFMLEGILLALAWLAALITGCVALLSGAVVLRDPSGRG